MKSSDSKENLKGNSQAKLRFRILRLFLTRKATDEGTVLVLVVMLGLLFMVLGVVAIAKSGADKTDTVINEAGNQGLAVAGGATEQMLAKLISDSTKKTLLLYNFDTHPYLGCTTNCNQWEQTALVIQPSTNTLVNSCYVKPDTSDPTKLVFDAATVSQALRADPLNLDSAGNYKYKILGYRYYSADKRGELFIKGTRNITGDTTASAVKVSLPVDVVDITSPLAGSALTATDMQLDQTDAIVDRIVCTDPANCPITCGSGATTPTYTQLRGGLGTEDSELSLAQLGTTTSDTDGDPTASGSQPEIMIGSFTIPDIPAAPSGAPVCTLGNLNSPSDVLIPGGLTKSGCGIPLATGETTTTPFPAHSDGKYYVQIGSWNKGDIVITTPKEVHLYVSGNIGLIGNEGLITNSSTAYNQALCPGTLMKLPCPGQVRLYGGSSNGTMPPDPVYNSSTKEYTYSQTFQMSGSSCVMAFIHAPKANIDVSGGGSGGCSSFLDGETTDVNIMGGSWTAGYNIDGTNSNSFGFMEQEGLMDIIASEFATDPAFKAKKVSAGSFRQWSREKNPE